MKLGVLARLLIDLLVLLLNDRGNDARGAISIEVDPRSVRVLVPLHFLPAENFDVFGRARHNSQLVFVDTYVLESLSLEYIGQGSVVQIVELSFLS